MIQTKIEGNYLLLDNNYTSDNYIVWVQGIYSYLQITNTNCIDTKLLRKFSVCKGGWSDDEINKFWGHLETNIRYLDFTLNDISELKNYLGIKCYS